METTLCNFYSLAMFGQVAQHFLRIFINNGGTNGNVQRQIVATPAGTISTAPLLATFGLIMPLKTVVDHGIYRIIRLQPNTATITTVAAIRTTFSDIFFSTEAKATVTTAARLYLNTGLIYKFHGVLYLICNTAASF